MPENVSKAGARQGANALWKGAPVRPELWRRHAFSHDPPPQSKRSYVEPQANEAGPPILAVIDGPYDAIGLSGVLARAPVNLGDGRCGINPSRGCDHGTFVIGALGARRDAVVPGLCPDCRLLHVPLFIDEYAPSTSVGDLANGIRVAIAAGARLINLSLAILGEDTRDHHQLAEALDCAEASGAVLIVAAGNQGHVAMGQLLSHPVTIPVVAVDTANRLLSDSNFGPMISRRGVAALGHQVIGYAPGGDMAVMSGTSVATAVASGTLAQLWSARPDADGADIRSAVACLGPRNGSTPPMIDRNMFLATLDQTRATMIARASPAERGGLNYASLQGERVMNIENGLPRLSNRGVAPAAETGQTAILAGGSAGCACGAPGGKCTCVESQDEGTGFVYAIGTVEAECPSVAIEREMQALASTLLPDSWESDTDVPTKPTEDRSWLYAVLSADKEMTRYIARQLTWRLTIEDIHVFILRPRDPRDYDLLIDHLSRSKYPRSDAGTGKTKVSVKKKAGGEKKASGSMPSGPPIERPRDIDVVVGVAGSQTPDGIEVLVDQIFALNEPVAPERPSPAGLFAGDLDQLADNYGLKNDDRAYNYLKARYALSPENLNEMEKRKINAEYELAESPAIYSRLSGDNRRIVRVIYTFNKYKGSGLPHQIKYFVRVDVTDEFPFIVTPWQPYLSRGEDR